MSDTTIKITINADNFLNALKHAPQELARNIPMAGMEALNEILDTEGLRAYPPETAANMPPTPYYIRGQGMQYASYNTGSSERYGSRYGGDGGDAWSLSARGYTAKAENTASYAPYVGGQQQAAHMARKGWRKLWDVAREKRETIRNIYDKWVAYTLRKAGLL